MKYIATFFALALVTVPQVAMAKTVVRGGEIISVTDEQVIEHDFYAWGGRVSMSGQVQGDMTALGGQLAVNGNIANDLSLAGGNVQVYGDVEDDVRIVAGEAIVAGTVKGDVFALAGSLTVLSTATVEGDVIFFGGEATIEGTVTGDIQGRMGTARVNSAVGGINLATERLTLGDNAVVAGDIQYKSATDVVRSPNATVEGTVVKNSPDVVEEDTSSFRPFLLLFVILAASGLVMLLALRRPIIRVLQPGGKYHFDMLYGLLLLFGGPLVSIIFLSTGLLTPIGLFLLCAYLAAVVFALVFSVIYVGTKVLGWAGVKATMRGIEVIFGALIVAFVAALPAIGPLCVLAILCATLGFLLRKSAHLLK